MGDGTKVSKFREVLAKACVSQELSEPVAQHAEAFLRVTEGELVTVIPPFSQVRDWFANVEIENRDWFADVEIVDWTSS